MTTQQAKRGPKRTIIRTPEMARKYRNELAAKRRKCAKFNKPGRMPKNIPTDPNKIVRILWTNCQYNNILWVRKLIHFGLNVNAINSKGWCPVHAAVHFRCYTILKLLLEAGADPNTPNANGVTPLMMTTDARYIRLISRFAFVQSSLQNTTNA